MYKEQLRCNYGDSFRSEHLIHETEKVLLQVIHCYFPGAGEAECTSGVNTAEKVKCPVFYAKKKKKKIAGRMGTAETANQGTQLCKQQLNVGLCA